MPARTLALAALALALACSRPKESRVLIARDDALDATRGAPATTGNVFANDSAATPDLPLRLKSFGQGARGDVRYNGDGTFTWEARPGVASGSDAFTYTIEDVAGATSTATVAVRIAPGWGKPTTLLAGGFPGLHTGSGGRVLVSWSELEGGVSRLKARHRDPVSGAWSAAETIDIGTGTAAFGSLLLADGAGGISVVWGQADVGGGEGLWIRRLSPAGVWEVQATRLSNAGALAIDDWWGAVLPGGGLAVAWQQRDATHAMWARRLDPAGSWGAAQQLEATGIGTSDSRDVAVVPLEGGGGVVLWKSTAGTLGSLIGSRFGPTGGFGASAQVNGASLVDTWDLLPLPDGGGQLVTTDSARQVFGQRLSAAGSWGAAAPISIGRVGTVFPFPVAMPDGGALIVWNEWPPARKELWANRLRPDGSFDGARLVDGGQGFANDFAFAALPGSGAVALWSDAFFLGGTGTRLASMAPAGTWGAPLVLADAQVRSRPVVDAAGKVHILRISADGVAATSSVWAETLDASGAPTGAVRLGPSTSPFLTLRIGVGAAGGLAAWVDGSGAEGALWASRLAGGQWLRGERVAGTGGAPAGTLLLEELADGSGVVVGFDDASARTIWANDWR
jgi:hypothetical protein